MTPDETWSLPNAQIGRQVWWYASLGSTNDFARSLANDPLHVGLTVIAGEQTAGRGQYGRTWLTPAGAAVLMSVILRPPPMLNRPVLLTAWAAVAACETVLELTGRSPTIKWPNDLYLDRRKICGILIEAHGPVVVAGLGLNVNQSAADFESAGLPDAGSLSSIVGGSWAVNDVARQLLQHLDTIYGQLCAGDGGPLETTWQQRLGLLGRTVIVTTFSDLVCTGQLVELSFAAVRVETEDGLRTFAPETIRQLRSDRVYD